MAASPDPKSAEHRDSAEAPTEQDSPRKGEGGERKDGPDASTYDREDDLATDDEDEQEDREDDLATDDEDEQEDREDDLATDDEDEQDEDRAAREARDPRRPAFLDDLPEHEALKPLIAAFVAGNYARLRQLEIGIRSQSTDPEVLDAARELVERTEPDPVAKKLLLLSVLFFLFIAGWVYLSHGQ